MLFLLSAAKKRISCNIALICLPAFREQRGSLLPSVLFGGCLHAGRVNPSAPARSLRLLERVCTPKTHELPSPSQLRSARGHSERVPLARPGTYQMGGSISPSSYPQRFLNEMSFVVTTTSVRWNKRKCDLNGLYAVTRTRGQAAASKTRVAQAEKWYRPSGSSLPGLDVNPGRSWGMPLPCPAGCASRHLTSVCTHATPVPTCGLGLQ